MCERGEYPVILSLGRSLPILLDKTLGKIRIRFFGTGAFLPGLIQN